ncbi:unnamed protein product [Enterobius vermicularis]|uniref:Cytochrome P450 n=1 Tax=Enterobius vermicularis TaxID=51028 RepID=A0A158QB15_ENTVE|nr:unnamed protein product [Enterobius vermicularis]
MLSPAFHSSIIQNYMTSFNKQAEVNFLLKIYKDETFDLLPYLRRFGLDVITETTLGVSLNAQKGENEDCYEAVAGSLELSFKSARYPWLRIKPIWHLLGYAKMMDKYTKITNVKKTFQVVKERKKEYEKIAADKKARKSFLDLLLSLQEEYNLSDEDVCDETSTVLIAGHDTTSANVGFTLFVLGNKKEEQDKVYEEVKSVFGKITNQREVTNQDLEKLVHLDRCVKEITRLYPPIIMFARRITEDVKVGIANLKLLRKIFNPDNFSEENCAKRDTFAYIPFSAGIRSCVGKPIALLERKVALIYLLRRYEFHSMLTEEQNRQVAEISLKPSRGFPMRITRRKKTD